MEHTDLSIDFAKEKDKAYKKLEKLLSEHDRNLNGYQNSVRVVGSCKTHGDFTQFKGGLTPLSKKPIDFLSSCPLCSKNRLSLAQIEVKELELAEKTQNKLKKIEKLESEANIGLRFLDADFDKFELVNDSIKQAKIYTESFYNSWQHLKKTGTSMIFTGNMGTGKTYLACALIKRLIHDYEQKCYIVNFNTILSQIKSSFNVKSPTTDLDIYEFYANFDFLVIDEIGVQLRTDFEKNVLFTIIDSRYRNLKPSMLISNHTGIDELASFVGNRVLDRMKDHEGLVVNFQAQSYRHRSQSCVETSQENNFGILTTTLDVELSSTN